MYCHLRYGNRDRGTNECKGTQHQQTHLRQRSVTQVRDETFLELGSDRRVRFVGEHVRRIPLLALLAMTEFIWRTH